MPSIAYLVNLFSKSKFIFILFQSIMMFIFMNNYRPRAFIFFVIWHKASTIYMLVGSTNRDTYTIYILYSWKFKKYVTYLLHPFIILNIVYGSIRRNKTIKLIQRCEYHFIKFIYETMHTKHRIQEKIAVCFV